MKQKLRYLTPEELKQKVGQVVLFEAFKNMPLQQGVLEFDGKEYYLPFCGKVKANNCKILCNE